MQDEFFSTLLKAISENRLAPYRQLDENDSDLTCHARYLWNTALSESLYPALQGLEVSLRNSIHNAITKERNNENWFEHILKQEELQVIAEVKQRLIDQKKAVDAAQLVASSNFGFWVSLLNTRYENVLWPKFLKEVFPYMPNRDRTRRNLSRRLNRIRDLRNRVFHHEPIWHREHLRQNHDDLIEAIAWINPSMLAICKALNRFPDIYDQGTPMYHKVISDYLESLGGNR